MTTIVTKNGSGAPLASDLVQGELAVDLTNKRLYTEDSGGSVIEVGTNPSTIDINAGTIDGTVIGGSSAAAGTFTTFTSTGIDDNATSTAITIDSSENVGIGTSSVSAISSQKVLEVEAVRYATLRASTTEGNNVIAYLQGNDNTACGQVGTETNHPLTFGTNDTERMRIDSSGNVGIGTTSPTAKLDVTVADGTVYSSSTTQTPSCVISNTTGANGAYSSLRLASRNSNGGAPQSFCEIANVSTNTTNYVSSMVFKTKNDSNVSTERMRIDSSGNVGIGTGSPDEPLDVNGNIAIGNPALSLNDIRFYESTAPFGTTRIRGTAGALAVFTANAERMRIDSSGNLLVGTTSKIGASRFSSVATGNNTPISGQNGATVTTVPLFNLYSNVGGTGTLRFQIQADGDAFNTGNSYGALSDERLKSNIVDASSQLDDIMAVQVRSYTLNATGDTHIGVVAQELEASGMSGLVKENQEGMKAVKYSVLYMKAIKALQEAVTRIETLEAEVAALKGA